MVNAATPYNAETPLELITESFITPADLFYVRNHLPVPVVDPDTWELEVIQHLLISSTITLWFPGNRLGSEKRAHYLIGRAQDQVQKA